jgi:hypothetical protein
MLGLAYVPRVINNTDVSRDMSDYRSRLAGSQSNQGETHDQHNEVPNA